MRKLKFLSFFFLPIIFITVSCTKEGPEGPAGAQGPQGPAGNNGVNGQQGPKGDQGQTGPTGIANVIYSAWLAAPTTSGASGWFDTTISTIGAVSRANFPAPSLTQPVIDQGITMVYHTTAASPPATGTANVQPLPFATNIGGEIVQFSHRPAVGRLVVFQKNLTSAASLAPLSAGNYFRYIILPGGVAGGRMMSGPAAGYSVDQLNAMPYDEIIRKFNIPQNGTNHSKL